MASRSFTYTLTSILELRQPVLKTIRTFYVHLKTKLLLKELHDNIRRLELRLDPLNSHYDEHACLKEHLVALLPCSLHDSAFGGSDEDVVEGGDEGSELDDDPDDNRSDYSWSLWSGSSDGWEREYERNMDEFQWNMMVINLRYDIAVLRRWATRPRWTNGWGA